MSKFILTKNMRNYHLAFGKYQFHLNKDMTRALRFNNPAYFIPGKYGKDFIKVIDAGECNIFEAEKGHNKLFVNFLGSNFKKTLHFETGNKSFYKLKENGEMHKSFSNIKTKFIDFSVISSQIKFPYSFKTVAFSEGIWHDTFYSWDVIKNAADKIINSPFVTYHIDANQSVLTEVGKVTDYEIDDNSKQLIVEGELFDTTAGKDIAVLLENKRITDVSVRIQEDSDVGQCNEIISWPHVAFVRDGEVTDAKIQNK